jgi:hypothetical protein
MPQPYGRRNAKMPSAQKKRIYNPVTGKYYEIRQHSSKYGTAGQIQGLWSSKKKKSSK